MTSVWATQHQSYKAVVGRIHWSLSGVGLSAPSPPFEGDQTLPVRHGAEIERRMAENDASEALVQC